MRKSFEFEKILNSEPAAVWKLLSKLDGVDQWAPIITACRVEGEGEGAIRHCTLADGSKIRERISKVDEEARAVGYSIEEGLPLSRYEGVFSIVERDGQSVLHWHIDAEGEAPMIAQVEGMLAEAAPAMLEGLDSSATK